MQKQPTKPSTGVLLLDKPAGPTSHDMVSKVRKASDLKRVGHSGTLDPFATGLLIIVVGSATRLIKFTHPWEKTYHATIILGATSDTDDVTGTITPSPTHAQPTQAAVQQSLQQFVGTIEQTPPIFSAVKSQGKKLYQLAREGQTDKAQTTATAKTRSVTIHDIILEAYTYPEVTITITCGTGTYIRSLARDLGTSLGIGAYVSTLRRTQIGPFVVSDALSPDTLTAETLADKLLPADLLVQDLPRASLSTPNVTHLRQGKTIPWFEPLADNQAVKLITPDKQLLGIGIYDRQSTHLKPDIILL